MCNSKRKTSACEPLAFLCAYSLAESPDVLHVAFTKVGAHALKHRAVLHPPCIPRCCIEAVLPRKMRHVLQAAVVLCSMHVFIICIACMLNDESPDHFVSTSLCKCRPQASLCMNVQLSIGLDTTVTRSHPQDEVASYNDVVPPVCANPSAQVCARQSTPGTKAIVSLLSNIVNFVRLDNEQNGDRESCRKMSSWASSMHNRGSNTTNSKRQVLRTVRPMGHP